MAFLFYYFKWTDIINFLELLTNVLDPSSFHNSSPSGSEHGHVKNIHRWDWENLQVPELKVEVSTNFMSTDRYSLFQHTETDSAWGT